MQSGYHKMKLIEIYLAKILLNQILLVIGVLAGIFAFVTLIDQVTYLGTGNYGLIDAFIYVFLSTPRIVYEIFPMAVLVGAILGLSILALDSELIVIRSSGISVGQITAAVLKLGLILAFIALIIGEFLVPSSETIAQRGRAEALERNVEQKSNSGLWMRESNTFVNVGEVLPDLTLRSVKIYQFEEDKSLKKIIFAEKGDYKEDYWSLYDIKQTAIDKNGLASISEGPKAKWNTPVNPQTMSVFLIHPDQLSIGQLRKYIEHLESNAQNAKNFELAYWSKLTSPLSTCVMLLIAIPFVFGSIRSGSMGRNLFIGIMIGIIFFAASKALGYIVLVYDFSPLAGAILPTFIFALASGFLFKRIP